MPRGSVKNMRRCPTRLHDGGIVEVDWPSISSVRMQEQVTDPIQIIMESSYRKLSELNLRIAL